MRRLLFIVVTLVGISCQTMQSHEDHEPEIVNHNEIMNTDEIRGEGTIIWNDFEGGFFGIQALSGAKYYPLNPLDRELQSDGIRVEFVLKQESNVITTVMWGTPVSVIRINKLGS